VECCTTPLQWLCEVAGYCQELEYAAIQIYPEHPKHAQWVSMQAMEELGHFQLPGIVYMRWSADEWHDSGPRDLFTIWLCIQIAIDKMQLSLLSVAYACPHHNPTSTMVHSQQTTRSHNTMHVVCGCEA
jgi:hypothetical protein